MEANSERDKSEYSFSDCDTHDVRSIRLGKARAKGLSKTLSSSCDRLPSLQNSQLLSSISRKLKPASIEVFSKYTAAKPRQSEPLLGKLILSYSCFPQLSSCGQSQWGNSQYCLDYRQLKSKPSQMDRII